MKPFLLCTDLDRTLIPNGFQPESALARERFKCLARQKEITLVYVTGRSRALIEQAIEDYDLPQPDFAIADVGSTIYRIDASGWQQWEEWEVHIAQDWQILAHDHLSRLLNTFPELQLQEPEKQTPHKLSFYVPLETDVQELLGKITAQLDQAGINANLIWSIDEAAEIGLLDILPAKANKLHAIRFLMQQNGFGNDNTVFAGDSGNDMDVLLSDIPSVLVANANTEVKKQAMHANIDTLYVARGDYLGMNGNYAAGILEGVTHYLPEVNTWLSQNK